MLFLRRLARVCQYDIVRSKNAREQLFQHFFKTRTAKEKDGSAITILYYKVLKSCCPSSYFIFLNSSTIWKKKKYGTHKNIKNYILL